MSVKVSAGATVMESPVCTPIGSTFSIEHTIIALLFLSLTTSISYSFHPKTDSSTRTKFSGEASKPELTISLNSSILYAIPPPAPPKVKEGRIITGRSSFFKAFVADSIEFT